MYVRNVAGYNFAFKYREAVIYIPCDGKIYSIPDDSGTYSELKVIQPMHIRTQGVQYINKDGSHASEKLIGHKRRGRPEKKVNPDKPLLGVRIKNPELLKPKQKNVETKEVETPTVDDNNDNSVMDIDLTNDVSVENTVDSTEKIKSKYKNKKSSQ